MSEFKHGPIRSYEVIWKSGHVETIQAHQVTVPLSASFFGEAPASPWVTFHGEVNGHWTLVLRALDEEITSIRLVPTESDAESAVSS